MARSSTKNITCTITINKNVPAGKIFQALRERHIYVRYFEKPRIDNYLRITIGTREEMQTLFDFLKDYLTESSK